MVSARGFCPEGYKLSEVKLKSVVGPFANAGAGWGSQANREFKRGPGGLCKEDCKHFVFSQHFPKCSRGANYTFRHMAEATEGGVAWCTDRNATHRTVLGLGIPNLAAYTKYGAFPVL